MRAIGAGKFLRLEPGKFRSRYIRHPSYDKMDAVHERDAFQFKELFVEIAKRLSEEDAHSLKFIYGVSDMPKNRTSALAMTLYVFEHLQRQGHLTPDRDGIKFLHQMLGGIRRVDVQKNLSKRMATVGLLPKDRRQSKIDKYFRSKNRQRKKDRQKGIHDYFRRKN